MTQTRIVGNACASLRELNQALNLEAATEDRRSQFLGYLANDSLDSVTMRLLPSMKLNPLFQNWLQQHFAQRAERVMARVREMRGGHDNDARFGSRMQGQGVWAQLLRQRFDKACARYGLSQQRLSLDLSAFKCLAPRAEVRARQACLF